MNRMPKRLLWGVLPVLVIGVALVVRGAPASTAVENGGGRLERLSESLETYVEEGRLAGAVALVAHGGETSYLQAVGQRDIAAGDPMETDDIFRIASQSKAIVSVAVMMLQEAGDLLISDPLGRYLPEYLETTVAVADGAGGYEIVPASRPITIRDLLTHTAGIGYGGGPGAELWADAGIQGWYFAHRDEPIRETVRRMAALPMDAQPGERFVYGYSTDILGALVEDVSGEPLDAFLRTRIFEPLGMVDTHFYLPEEKRDRLSVVYSASADGLAPAPDPGGMVGQGAYVDGPRTSFSGGAGLLSTARDYARFLQMMLNGGELDGARILSSKSVELMTVNHVGDRFGWESGGGFGLGFSVLRDLGARGTPGSVGEYGWGGAYHSTYWVDPDEDLVVVYFTQLIPTGDVDDHAKLRTLVYQAIDELQ
ncbi:serine hydrolase domain-containing protein [Candidatus Palauibacter sp.]|uniref:serine hydrolase domain-containing protein n=2 Tax=Candidatus Palauibacter sp. TaxID=3101350 RepID=UPI003B5A12D5